MKRYHISLSSKDFKQSDGNQLILERTRKLNNEWTYVCIWKGNPNFKPHSIEFRRVSSTDVVSISGMYYTSVSFLSIARSEKRLFSKLIDSGSSSTVIYFKDDIFESFSTNHYLKVDVILISGNGDCRDCSHLVELSNDLGRLLDPETCTISDVILKCSDVSIPAHKLILSARSPVFAAMFKNPMRESRENEVVISDMDATVLRLMLTYVYTAKLSDLTVSSAADLLVAADKYLLGDMKRLCCEFLKDNISLENVLRILVLGDLHDRELKSFAIDYVCDSCKGFAALEKTEEWQTLRKERPDLTTDILTSVVKTREKI